MTQLNAQKASTQEIEEMFETAFLEQVASKNQIDDFEVSCERSTDTDQLVMRVNIVGFAGSPTIYDFQEGKVEDGNKVTVSRPDLGSLDFVLDTNDIVSLTGNDYQLTYKS